MTSKMKETGSQDPSNSSKGPWLWGTSARGLAIGCQCLVSDVAFKRVRPKKMNGESQEYDVSIANIWPNAYQ